ncbi:MAG: acyltransferase [Planctomycetales bacterium]|nr:acyltransferase [Planctomycetales bacterium]
MTSRSSNHIPILAPLRGTAAIAVCLFHFTRDGRTLDATDIVAFIGSFGWLGVEAFFVISGFVIPFSMYLRSYRMQDSGPFLVRRLKRLEPPYFASIFIIIALPLISMLVPGFRGNSQAFTWPQLAAHVAYLNAILGYSWINPVFWTLAIEFQYYIFAAIAFPLLAHPRNNICRLSAPAIALLGFAGSSNKALLPHWLPLFALGMVGFQFYVGLLAWRSFLPIFVLCVAISQVVVGTEETVVGLLTVGLIIVTRDRPVPKLLKPLSFLGTISYSLYLLHEPVGNRIFNLAGRLPESIVRPLPVLIAGLGGSILIAYGFWRIVEEPSQRWAKMSKWSGPDARSPEPPSDAPAR